MQTVIEVQDLSFDYGAEPVLHNVDFSVQAGDFVAIIGSNGTGKSTLLRLLLRELVPTSGTIALFGEDIRHFRQWPRLGYVPQNGIDRVSSFPATAAEIVQANLYAQIGALRLPGKAHREKTLAALRLVEMEPYAHRMIGELSGGQLQRVMLARVLVGGCEVMLLDEPTNGIDAAAADALYKLLYKLNKHGSLTIVMVTHDMARSVEYVGRTLCLEEGSLLELDKQQLAYELNHKHKHPKN